MKRKGKYKRPHRVEAITPFNFAYGKSYPFKQGRLKPFPLRAMFEMRDKLNSSDQA